LAAAAILVAVDCIRAMQSAPVAITSAWMALKTAEMSGPVSDVSDGVTPA
jgi:hypothetical protein